MKKSEKKRENWVIVRCSSAGVHFGILKSHKSGEVVLMKSRRLWRWWSQFTLSELSQLGPKQEKISENRFSIPVPEIKILGACEIIPCSEAAVELINAVPNANQ